MKKIALTIILFISIYDGFSQVGIGTTSPDASSILHVESTNKGMLTPRLTTTERNSISNPAKGLLIYNTTLDLFEYNSGTASAPIWTPINANSSVSSDAGNIITSGTDSGAYLGTTVYFGKFIISGTGNQTITGLPFQPTSIKFTAHANVESYNVNLDNGVGNNNGTFQNAFGSCTGYATNYGGSISQQVIYIGGSGNSINNISRYASSSRAIGIRYSNQNGGNLGLTAASVTSFNADGFTINVSNHTENIVVLYEAHR
ncbi:hypothetical protein BWZ22_03375 [Seonamhaeicola sp. S2-3]|uniref:hypothetical protein n=1 Tax=Seonamhaeicola sp. S2-3 TaxID=1936081 RepID=UPI0009729CC4|nr:hypothetical protein [Seonamhaeicola sp. S2-3]APY10335.1 hypothetical protein BWZ22_03375 [Seonamhaeicola sp. S2-3]